MGDGFVERVVDERGFARTGHAGDANHAADGQLECDVLEVVAARTLDDKLLLAIQLEPRLRHVDFFLAGQILPCQRLRRLLDLLRRAFRHHHPAVDTSTRPHIDHVVCVVNRLLVVFYHDHRVAQIAQTLERLQ